MKAIKQDKQVQEMFIDYFAGLGGASQGIYQATGRHVDIAINHSADAISMHKLNHPQTHHIQESVWDVDPAELLKGKKVGLLWGSPDCRHHSKALGGVPRDKNIRGLSWVLLKFALVCRPLVFGMENVEEIQSWGPLVKGKPCKKRAGETFNGFVRAWQDGITPKHGAWKEMIRTIGIEFDIKAKLKLFKGLGYELDYKELKMSDYGIPTTRKRFFLVARCDGKPLSWPEPTHANHKLKKVQRCSIKSQLLPNRAAAECIDWSIKCKSILGRKKMLVENSLRRIVRGINRFVIDDADPYVVPREKTAKIIPFITEHANSSSQRNFAVDEPLRTQCASVKGGHFAIVTPTFICRQFGKSVGSAMYDPVGAITAGGGGKTSIVVGSMVKNYGGGYTGPGSSLHDPVSTLTTVDHNALLTSHMIKFKGTNIGHRIDQPIQTLTSGGLHFGEVRSLLLKVPLKEPGMLSWPLPDTTNRDKFNKTGTDIPARELTEDERYNAWWIARLVEEYSDSEPAQTMPLLLIPKPRVPFIEIDGWILADIGMRMLVPRELARAHDFPESYILERGACGKRFPITAQVKGLGNSVPPPMVELIIRSMCPEYCVEKFTYQEAA